MTHAAAPVAFGPEFVPDLRPNLGLRRTALAAVAAILVLFGVLGLWASTAVIGGAVVAQGQAVVRGHPKEVQTLDGGTIAAIAVRDGDRVTQGDILLRLDATLARTDLDIAQNRLGAALALQARLRAEQDGTALDFTYPDLATTLPTTSLPAATRPDTMLAEAGQRQIFEARRAVIVGGRDRLAGALLQTDAQIHGTETQIAAILEQIGYLDDDIASQQQLVSQGLARQSQLSDLRRIRAQLAGEQAALEAEVARLHSSRDDATIATLQSERSFMEQVATDLRATTMEIGELVLQIVTLEAQLDRMDIRAPVTGIIHEMQASTPGGVLAPGASVLRIVPTDAGLDFEVRINPHSIDDVHVGQEAQIALSSLDPQTTPRLAATVVAVSADTVSDPRTGAPFYRVTLDVTPDEVARLDAALLPGMPIEAYLGTSDRSVLTYLLHPISTRLTHVFRE